MSREQRFRWIFNGILFLFLATMAYVTYRCYTRQSGSTGLDMAQMQKIRYDALVQHPGQSIAQESLP